MGEPNFPPEIWEQIFQNCSYSQLLQNRLVCRQWNGIILSCPTLRSWFRVLLRGGEIQLSHAPAYLPPVTKAVLHNFTTLDVGSWWSGFGRNLEDLCFNKCEVTVGEMWYLLRHCPKLKKLELGYVGFRHGEGVNDFRLESLEELTVGYVYKNPAVIALFGPIFPRLKSFYLVFARDWNKLDIISLSRFIETVQGTLKTLMLPSDIQLFDSMALMERLQLEHADFSIDCQSPRWDMQLWTKFCQAQNMQMQDLSLRGDHITDEVLCVAVQNMPRLKKLFVRLGTVRRTVPTFLNHLSSSAREVHLEAEKVSLDFRTELTPSLWHFRLLSGSIMYGIEHLMTAKHIENISLQNVEISHCPIPQGLKSFSALKFLGLFGCNISPGMLAFILSRHPLLEAVTIYNSSVLVVDNIVNLLWRSPKLQKMVLGGCPGVAETSGEEIMKRYFEKYNLIDGSRTVKFTIDNN